MGHVWSIDPGLESLIDKKFIKWFWSNVNKTNSCWLWTAKAMEASRGKRGNRTRRKIHVIAWRVQTGRRCRPGFELCHTCDVRRCIRRKHLWEGTHKQNMYDSIIKDRAVFPPTMLGEANPTSKLTDNDVRKIKNRLNKGEGQTSISKDFPVTNCTIWLIAHGKKWVHIQ